MSGKCMKFEPYKDKGGRWRWRLWATNGRIVAVSGESFASRRNAERAVLAIPAQMKKHGCYLVSPEGTQEKIKGE